MRPALYPLHILKSPIEGYEELRWNNAMSLPASFFVLALWFVAAVLERQLTGYSFNLNDPDALNVFFVLIRTIVVFTLWVTANSGLSALLEGRGTYREIWIFSAYALTPYVALSLLTTFLSNFMVQEEGIFLTWAENVGIMWSTFLMVVGIKVVHEYSFPRSIWACALSIVGIVLIIFVFLLMSSLFTQLFVFFGTLVSEIIYMLI
jgi:hypothetical protein